MSDEESDTRRFRNPKSDDYYVAKAAREAKAVTRWPKCVVCGQNITGQNYGGRCHRCFNDNALGTMPIVVAPPVMGGGEWDVSEWNIGFWWT